MSIEQNKQLARDFMDALARADIQFIQDAFAPDGVSWTAGTMPISGTRTRDQVAEAARGILGVFPDGLKFSIKNLTAEGDRVAIEAESYGRHASGKTYANQYHFLMRVRGGKIAEWREYLDTMHANEVLCAGPAAG
jgi:ketosteroid isomerase-like protein